MVGASHVIGLSQPGFGLDSRWYNYWYIRTIDNAGNSDNLLSLWICPELNYTKVSLSLLGFNQVERDPELATWDSIQWLWMELFSHIS
jgi:hypothetical protein